MRELDPTGSGKYKSPLNIFNMNPDGLLKEIEAIDSKLKLEDELKNGNDSDGFKEDSISGSDSEPSLDNFENDQLVKLLPTFVKKKSIFKKIS